MADKKYQVFISSTYADLKDERRKILDILLMADCIPSGMEAFVATDNEQFEVIKKVIDLCDYYVLIIGKRYGSISSVTSKSYTEMEYDYAKSVGIPVLVFAIDESVELPVEKTETNKSKISLLRKFRDKALKNRLATIWRSTDELTGALGVSIMQAKEVFIRPGWRREQTNENEVNSLLSENVALKSRIVDLSEIKLKINSELMTNRIDKEDLLKQQILLTNQLDSITKENVLLIVQKKELENELLNIKSTYETRLSQFDDALQSEKYLYQRTYEQDKAELKKDFENEISNIKSTYETKLSKLNDALQSEKNEHQKTVERSRVEYEKDILQLQSIMNRIDVDQKIEKNFATVAKYYEKQKEFILLWEERFGDMDSYTKDILTADNSRKDVSIYKIFNIISTKTRGFMTQKSVATTLRKYIYNHPHLELFRLTYTYCEDLLRNFQTLGLMQSFYDETIEMNYYELTSFGETFVTKNVQVDL